MIIYVAFCPYSDAFPLRIEYPIVVIYFSMKIFTSFITIYIVLISLAQADSWTILERCWDNYLAQPTHENAVKVYQQLPNEILKKNFLGERLIDKMYESWPHLSKKIVAGNTDAVQIGFKLYAVVDGAFKEEVGADLGKLITLNTTLFLQQLKKHRQLVQNLEGIVCNYGEAYVDKKDLQIEEKDTRMRLLVNVNDPDLEDVKSECLKALMNDK